jgi:hypothetical protein
MPDSAGTLKMPPREQYVCEALMEADEPTAWFFFFDLWSDEGAADLHVTGELTELEDAESEDLFSFLNRSARSDVVNIRAELERWFESYPKVHQTELRSKFRDRRQHLSTWWELYVHQLFTLLGLEVEVHPELDGVSTRPDFKVTGPMGAARNVAFRRCRWNVGTETAPR